MTYLEIYFTFFKIGLFTIGGGLSAIPLLQSVAVGNNWLTQSAFADMIAVSQSTPGPIGINMATYVGFDRLGILGSIIATLGMVSPSIIVITLISKFLTHFNEHKIVQGLLSGIRPVVIGIIFSAAYNIALIAMFNLEAYNLTKQLKDLIDIKTFILFVLFMIATTYIKKHPILFVIASGFIGIIIF